MFYIDPAAYEQHKELGLPYVPSSHDHQLTTFFTELEDKTKYTTQISIMTRLKSYNEKGEMKEYLTWTESLSGLDKDGNTIAVHDIPCGQTKELVNVERFKGLVVAKQYNIKVRYTVLWSKEEAQKLIVKSTFKKILLEKSSPLLAGQ